MTAPQTDPADYCTDLLAALGDLPADVRFDLAATIIEQADRAMTLGLPLLGRFYAELARIMASRTPLDDDVARHYAQLLGPYMTPPPMISPN
jgi:hypothetical protein